MDSGETDRRDDVSHVNNALQVKRCDHDGCSTIPCFGAKGSKKAVYCARHAEPGMVDVANRTCVVVGCFRQPHFGVPGSKKAQYCAQHTVAGTVDVTSKSCAHDGCTTKPFFGWEGTKRTEYCSRHKKKGMRNLYSPTCLHPSCSKYASFGVQSATSPGTGTKEYCAAHKQVGMVNLTKKSCAHPTCLAKPVFNTPGTPTPQFCQVHAAGDMVDVRRSRCAHPNCTKLTLRVGKDGRSQAMCPLHVTSEEIGVVLAPAGKAAAAAAAADGKTLNESKKRGRVSTAKAPPAATVSPRFTRLSATRGGGDIPKRARSETPRPPPSPQATVNGSDHCSSPRVPGTESEKALLSERDEDFESQMGAKPTDGAIWARHVNTKLSLADLDAARFVGARGLAATVSTGSAAGRSKLWASLIDVEHKLGTAASFKEVSLRACDDSEMFNVFPDIAQLHARDGRQTDGWCEKCESLFRSCMKRKNCRHSKEVWIAIQVSRLHRGYVVGAWEMLQLSLRYLPGEEHVFVISRFALHNLRFGSTEHGREIYECLLQAYPERLDIWKEYVEAEAEKGGTRVARDLLRRLGPDAAPTERRREVIDMCAVFEKSDADDVGRTKSPTVSSRVTRYIKDMDS